MLSSRRQLALRQPFQRYRAVGVSFGGAQEAVKLLQPGDAAMELCLGFSCSDTVVNRCYRGRTSVVRCRGWNPL